jgi:hypothetical protein
MHEHAAFLVVNLRAPAAIVGAVLNALRPLRVTDIELSVTPARAWAAVETARSRRSVRDACSWRASRPKAR